jgi:hypothetical protein
VDVALASAPRNARVTALRPVAIPALRVLLVAFPGDPSAA